MGSYEIRIKIELVESNKVKTGKLVEKSNDGSFTMAISEKDAISIDACEKSILQTAYPAIREALKDHLTQISKKKQLKETIRKK